MKALTIKQPYASLIIAGLKKWETRSWSTDYRGPLLIHASTDRSLINQVLDHVPSARTYLFGAGYNPRDLPTGAIIGQVNLIAIEECAAIKAYMTETEVDLGFWLPHNYAWLFDKPTKINAYKCSGNVKLWDLPDHEYQKALLDTAVHIEDRPSDVTLGASTERVSYARPWNPVFPETR